MKKALILFICMLFLTCTCAQAFSFKKKKEEPPKEKMVETVEEYEIQSQQIPVEERKLDRAEPPKSDKKNYFPQNHYVFEKYNYPAGRREPDLVFLRKNLKVQPTIVADVECEFVAYPIYYYNAEMDQVRSEFYVGRLDKSKTKTQRILDYDHYQARRAPIIQSGFDREYQRLFSGLSVVDWSLNSQKILIKERIGSTVGGNYRDYIWIYFKDKNKAKKLDSINQAIIDYYYDLKGLALNQYKYELVPLGFRADNDDVIALHCFVYDNEGNKLFLGTWGYDLDSNQVILISKNNPSVSLSANGLVLKQVLE